MLALIALLGYAVALLASWGLGLLLVPNAPLWGQLAVGWGSMTLLSLAGLALAELPEDEPMAGYVIIGSGAAALAVATLLAPADPFWLRPTLGGGLGFLFAVALLYLIDRRGPK